MLQTIAAASSARRTLRRIFAGGLALCLFLGALLAGSASLDMLAGTRDKLAIEKKPELIIIDPWRTAAGNRIA